MLLLLSIYLFLCFVGVGSEEGNYCPLARALDFLLSLYKYASYVYFGFLCWYYLKVLDIRKLGGENMSTRNTLRLKIKQPNTF